LIRKRLDEKFFNMLTLMLVEADGSKPKGEDTDEDGHEHGGTLKVDATCCDAEVRYPTPKGTSASHFRNPWSEALHGAIIQQRGLPHTCL